MLAALAEVVDGATEAFEGYDYARALERTEAFFWTFCDDYIELVKGRAYGEGVEDEQAAASGRRALRLALDVLLRLFAPVLAFAAEEVWSWEHDDSVHRQPWPTSEQVRAAGAGDDAQVLTARGRRARRGAQGEEHRQAVDEDAGAARRGARATRRRSRCCAACEVDLRNAGVVQELAYVAASEPSVVVELVPPEEQA